MAEDWGAIAADVRAGLADVGNTLTITRETPGVPDPEKPWVPVQPTTISETVPQIGEGSGAFRSGETIISTDFEFMISVPSTLVPKVGDGVLAGGSASTVVKVDPFPAGGEPVYFTIWSNI